MWTRALLKDNAKQALRGRYWPAFGVCLVMALLGVAVSGGGGTANLQATYTATQNVMGSNEEVWTGNNAPANAVEGLFESIPAAVWGVFGSMVLFAVLIGLCWGIFLTGPLEVGMRRWFMESRQSPTPFGTVWTVFRTPYLNVVKVQLLVSLKILLGTFLFIIPGIYWSYCYFMVRTCWPRTPI